MKPLTIEQLKALPHRDWLWVVGLKTKTATYAQILSDGIVGDADCRYLCMDDQNAEIDFSTYGKTWLAYKNKEQAEAKGELVEFPCKVGDWVYYARKTTQEVLYGKVASVKIDYDGIWIYVQYYRDYSVLHSYEDFKKNVFYGRNEAERRLVELKGEKQ